ncbi:MAG: hypothetical protein ACW99Q_20550 [Candidatus Kariarchaeaceae archaeon]|jgi:hypothetical protein
MDGLKIDPNTVLYGNTQTSIKNFDWYNTFPFKPLDNFYTIIYTPVQVGNVQVVLMDTFAKIFDIDIDVLSEEFKPIYFYGISCRLYSPNFWKDQEEKLFLYSMSIIHTFQDMNIQNFPESFLNVMYNIAEGITEPLNPERFFHAGMAKFINSIYKHDYRERGINYWDSFKFDLRAIKYILNSPQNTREVLTRVSENNFTKISEEIFNEFEKMRRTF